ncbi:MAG: translation elongation factor-like protein [Gemmatimonadota bacterium]|nr:MAG: translation elongation factor-like protein [Gemmatimonadota bacterium]
MAMTEELVGTITHYFAKPEVGVVKLTVEIKIGDTLHFHGHTTDFQQEITSMQVEHVDVETAAAGTEVAIRLKERVRPHDEVYRVTPY